MLTRCPACETQFRVTAEQLKARSGRVRCGACQHVFNALDTLIEVPIMVSAPPTGEPAPQPEARSEETDVAPAPAPARSAPAETLEPVEEAIKKLSAWRPETQEQPLAPEAETAEAMTATEPEPDATDWSEAFPEPPPPPRRWPWAIGSALAILALGLQAALAFRVELAVVWPETKPVLVALCDVADCEVGLPAKVALMGIEASDLHPDTQHNGRLALAATLKNRAPFAQQFPHLELTLTDTADKAIARKVLAPADYLPPKSSLAQGMQPNADIMVAVGVELGEMTASGYRLYLFYP